MSFHIKEGEAVVIKGESGSGKSTLLSIISGLLKPTNGEALLDEVPISKIPDDHATLFRREHIGFVFQKYNLIPNLSVFENVSSTLVPTSLSVREAKEKTQIALERFHIAHKSQSLVKNLSGGEQQRCAIARAIVNNPKIILADEPSANLDSRLTLELINLLTLLKEMGKTIITVTHDEKLAGAGLFDRSIMLKDGTIV